MAAKKPAKKTSKKPAPMVGPNGRHLHLPDPDSKRSQRRALAALKADYRRARFTHAMGVQITVPKGQEEIDDGTHRYLVGVAVQALFSYDVDDVTSEAVDEARLVLHQVAADDVAMTIYDEIEEDLVDRYLHEGRRRDLRKCVRRFRELLDKAEYLTPHDAWELNDLRKEAKDLAKSLACPVPTLFAERVGKYERAALAKPKQRGTPARGSSGRGVSSRSR